MGTWLTDRVSEVRARMSPTDEDSLWLLLFDDPHGEPVVACAITGALAEMDNALLSNLATLLDEGPWKAALLAIPRSSGVPHASDQAVWSALRELTATTELIDLVVVGRSTSWSVKCGVVAAQ